MPDRPADDQDVEMLVHGSSMVEDPANVLTLCDSSYHFPTEVMELGQPHPGAIPTCGGTLT